MKLKQFEFRLFPRLKSRKKKKAGKTCNYDFPRDIGLDRNSNYSTNGYYSYLNNLAVETNCRDGLAHDICHNNSNYVNCCYVSRQETSMDCSFISLPPEIHVSSDFSYEGCDCMSVSYHSDRAGPLFRPETPLGTPSTLPRTRTRIKTNPWLPSPRDTPTPSPTDLPLSISSEIMTSPAVRSSSRLSSSIPSSSSLSIVAKDLETQECNIPVCNKSTDQCYKGGIYDAPAKTRFLSKGENKDCVTGKVSSENYDGDISGSSSPERAQTNDNFHDGFDFEEHYEDSVDELLETGLISRDDTFESLKGKICGDQKATESPEAAHLYNSKCNNSSLDLKLEFNNSCDTKSFMNRDVTDDFTESDSPTGSESQTNSRCHDKHSSNMQDSIDTGYGSGSRDVDCDSLSSGDILDNTQDHSTDMELEWDNEPTAEQLIIDNQIQPLCKKETEKFCDNMEDSNIWMTRSLYDGNENRTNSRKHFIKRDLSRSDFGLNSKAYKRRSRSLADIELSLDEKVTMLREEKTYVQRKIQESIYEDKIRQNQEKALDGLTQPEKKEVLMKTLYDLKARLEDQSARLQSSYSTILTLRKRFSQRRRSSTCPLETEV